MIIQRFKNIACHLINTYMKYMPFIVLIFVSCTKQNATDSYKNAYASSNAIQEKWNIITDSFYSGVGIGNHLTAYVGKNGDYFDFKNDGNIYVKEDTGFDTLSYHLIFDSTIIIESFGLTLNGIPDTSRLILTDHSASIISPEEITPGGIFERRIYLSK